MIKKYLYIAVLLAMIGAGTYGLGVYQNQLDAAFKAGQAAAEQTCTDEKLIAVQAALDEQSRIRANDEQRLVQQLDEQRRRAETFARRYAEAKRYANPKHQTDSDCNYSVGTMRMLNDTVRERAGLPAAAALDETTAAGPSVVTGNALVDWGNSCVTQYYDLSDRYRLLLDMVADRGG